MEVVLGIDNIVFISILTDKLPKEQQPKARSLGLSLALGSRLALLFSLSWVMGLKDPLFAVMGKSFSGRDLILLIGGLFLLAKATMEIFDKMEAAEPDAHKQPEKAPSYGMILFQIGLLDIVFSLDSVITAVGMAQELIIMITAMVISMLVMLVFAGRISSFINRRPSMKILALSFLMLIGAMLVGEGFGQHINKAYIYFAMAFSLLVEIINIRVHTRTEPVALHPSRRDPRMHDA